MELPVYSGCDGDKRFLWLVAMVGARCFFSPPTGFDGGMLCDAGDKRVGIRKMSVCHVYRKIFK